MPGTPSELLLLIRHLTDHSKAHISLHFMSGAFTGSGCFSLPFENAIHDCPFCLKAKDTPKGSNCCLKNKKLSVQKAVRDKQTYTGSCYLGVTEVVVPVFWGGRPYCIIYVGNLLVEENRAKVEETVRRRCRRTKADAEAIIKDLSFLQTVPASGLSYYAEIAHIVAFYITSLLDSLVKNQGKEATDKKSSNHWMIQQAKNYIQAYYNSNITLSAISGIYFVNPQYFCRLFSHEMGISFSSYLNGVRIEKAKELLKQTDKSVTEIAFSVGFHDMAYFITVFKKLTAQTPTQYRRSAHGGEKGPVAGEEDSFR